MEMRRTAQTELISEQEWIDLCRSLHLSERQAQIARGVVRGKGDKQIAYELGVSMSTVRTYMGRLFRKFDLHDRVALIVHMFQYVREQSIEGHNVPGNTGPEDEIASSVGREVDA
jgi:DNA-binding NarL/FixJ family response regulator